MQGLGLGNVEAEAVALLSADDPGEHVFDLDGLGRILERLRSDDQVVQGVGDPHILNAILLQFLGVLGEARGV